MTPDLFPLPLTPFEYYYWCDNRPESPTTYPVNLDFRGRLERDRLVRALQIVAARHPLLSARVEPDARAEPQWVPGPAPEIDWAGQDVPIAPPAGPMIDLAREPGLRVFVREGPETVRLTLQFHHACCDGLSAFRLVEELLWAYDHVCGDRPHPGEVWPLDPARLARRGDIPPPPPGLLPALWTVATAARYWAKMLWQAPEPLAAPASDPAPEPGAYLGYEGRTLDRDLTGRLRRAAGAQGCTLNHLLVRDALVACRRWNLAHGARDGGWLRVNMPTSLRERADLATPAANLLSFGFVGAKARQCDAPERLLTEVARQVELIKRNRLELFFLGGLEIARKRPGMIPRMLEGRRSFATVVVSYLGQLFARSRLTGRDGRVAVDGAVLESIGGTPPIRPLTRAAIVAFRYAGQAWIHVRCEPQLFSPRQTREFLDLYVDQLVRGAP